MLLILFRSVFCHRRCCSYMRGAHLRIQVVTLTYKCGSSFCLPHRIALSGCSCFLSRYPQSRNCHFWLAYCFLKEPVGSWLFFLSWQVGHHDRHEPRQMLIPIWVASGCPSPSIRSWSLWFAQLDFWHSCLGLSSRSTHPGKLPRRISQAHTLWSVTLPNCSRDTFLEV